MKRLVNAAKDNRLNKIYSEMKTLLNLLDDTDEELLEEHDLGDLYDELMDCVHALHISMNKR